MNQGLLSLLQSPDNHTALHLDDQASQLVDEKEQFKYPIEQQVPILLPENARKKAQQAEQHVAHNTQFQYIDHYQVDAEEFDYFEAFIDGASIHAERRLQEAIIAEVPKTAQSILDVGCGKAWVAAHFCPKGKQVYSLDVSTVNPIKAIQKYPYDNHFALVGDVYHLPLKPGSFDCIIASEIIEHVPNPKIFIEVLVQALKPGGQLIITTPYNEKIVYSLCIHCNCPTPLHAHIHSFTEKKIGAMVPKQHAKIKANYAFANKALVKLQTHVFLKHLSFKLWYGVDRVVNKILNKRGRLLLKVERS